MKNVNDYLKLAEEWAERVESGPDCYAMQRAILAQAYAEMAKAAAMRDA
jgi:hypothetical protein